MADLKDKILVIGSGAIFGALCARIHQEIAKGEVILIDTDDKSISMEEIAKKIEKGKLNSPKEIVLEYKTRPELPEIRVEPYIDEPTRGVIPGKFDRGYKGRKGKYFRKK